MKTFSKIFFGFALGFIAGFCFMAEFTENISDTFGAGDAVTAEAVSAEDYRRGKYEIIDNYGNGKYKVRVWYDRYQVFSLVTKYQRTINGFEERIAEINAGDLTEALIIERDILRMRVVSLEKKIAALNDLDEYVDIDNVWCIDYSPNLSGDEVACIFPVRDRGRGANIKGGFADGAAFDDDTDGVITQSQALSAAGMVFNYAITEGAAKWKPTYRYGTITAITGDLSTCDVALDTVETEVGGDNYPPQTVSLNLQDDLTGVLFEYMDCNGAAFATGDAVVVQQNYSWTFVADTPAVTIENKVIGFQSEPRSCGEYVYVACFEKDWSPDPGLTAADMFVKKYFTVDPVSMTLTWITEAQAAALANIADDPWALTKWRVWTGTFDTSSLPATCEDSLTGDECTATELYATGRDGCAPLTQLVSLSTEYNVLYGNPRPYFTYAWNDSAEDNLYIVFGDEGAEQMIAIQRNLYAWLVRTKSDGFAENNDSLYKKVYTPGKARANGYYQTKASVERYYPVLFELYTCYPPDADPWDQECFVSSTIWVCTLYQTFALPDITLGVHAYGTPQPAEPTIDDVVANFYKYPQVYQDRFPDFPLDDDYWVLPEWPDICDLEEFAVIQNAYSAPTCAWQCNLANEYDNAENITAENQVVKTGSFTEYNVELGTVLGYIRKVFYRPLGGGNFRFFVWIRDIKPPITAAYYYSKLLQFDVDADGAISNRSFEYGEPPDMEETDVLVHSVDDLYSISVGPRPAGSFPWSDIYAAVDTYAPGGELNGIARLIPL